VSESAPEAGYRHFEVAADVGVEAWGPTVEACFRQCALGMFTLMVPVAAVAPVESREVVAQGETLEALLVSWLNELVYLHDVEGFVLHDVTALSFDGLRLHAALSGEPVDPTRHPRGVLVKAATFHQLTIVREPGRVCARVILDI
jgi:SHS2 domain-containing protein